MEKRTTIINELKEISPLLADLPLLNPYSVPYRYFEQLPEQVLGSLKSELLEDELRESSMGRENTVPLPSLPPKQPFQVPQGYFEGLAGSIMEKIRSIPVSEAMEETRAISTIVADTPKIQPYTVPPGYFDSLSKEVLFNAKSGKAAKVVRMPFAKNLIRYAAAAAITGLVALAVFFLSQKNTTTSSQGIAFDKVPLQELENYVSGSIETPETTVDYAGSDLSANDIKEFIGDISDEALQQYLSQNKAGLTLTN